MRWPSIKEKLQAQHDSEKRKAEAEESEQRRASQQKAKESRVEKSRQERVRHFEVLKRRYNDDIFEVTRAVRKLTADLTRLQEKDDEDSRKERERNGWLAYLTSPIYGKQKETEDEKMARETERIQRLAIKRIKKSELKEKVTKLNRLHDANNKIAIKNEKAEEAIKVQIREENLRKAKEASMKMEQEMREKRARFEEIRVKAQKERAEREAKKAREAEAALKAQEELERARKAVEAERYKQEVKQAQRRQEEHERTRKASAKINRKLTEERKRATHAAEEAVRNAQAQAAFKYRFSHDSNSTSSSCKHERYWLSVMGRQQCQNCNLIQNRFAFLCPSCRMMACASCRQMLRGEVHKGR